MTFCLEAMASDTTALIPLLRNGGTEMARLGENARTLGGIMSTSTISSLTGLRVALNDTGMAVKGIGYRISGALAPALTSLAIGFNDAMREGGLLRGVIDGLVGSIDVIIASMGVAVVAFGVRYVAALALASGATTLFSGALFILKGLLKASLVGGLIIGLGYLVTNFAAVAASAKAAITQLRALLGIDSQAETATRNFNGQLEANKASMLNAATATKAYREELIALIKVQGIEAYTEAERIGVILDTKIEALDAVSKLIGPNQPFVVENIKIVEGDRDRVQKEYEAAVEINQSFIKQLSEMEAVADATGESVEVVTTAAVGLAKAAGGGKGGAAKALKETKTAAEEAAKALADRLSSAASAATGGGGGGGLLNGLFSNAIGGFGENAALFGGKGLAAGFGSLGGGTGLLGGLGNTLANTFGTGGGIGGLFSSIGGGAGIMSSIGAALPVISIALAVFSFFKKKTKLLDSGIRGIRSCLRRGDLIGRDAVACSGAGF